MVEVKKTKCKRDVIIIDGRYIWKAFTEGKEYDVYIEDNGQTIWAYNNKGRDHILRDFESDDYFFESHFEIQ